MNKIFTEDYLIQNFLATVEECEEEIQQDGAGPIELELGTWDKPKIQDFANGLLWADFKRWLETGESKVADLYKTYVVNRMEARLFEADPYKKELKEFINARERGCRRETK